ncbi:FtsX-like permease family protein [Paenibacillus sp. M1]|uniref:FtsX-like permease family protein n=1 Tax=Paenibacillus haidiansis TaxID=1574488 RepID=A0ABU7VSL2_9BACL
MIMQTHNGRAVARLAHRSLRSNRMRSLIIVCAIVLTTLLITSVFTMAFSINRSMEQTQMRTAGSDFHGSFKYLTPDEADKLAEHSSIKEYGRAVLVGWAANEAFRGSRVEIDQVDENSAKHSFIRFDEGGLPVGEDEIVLSTWTLDLLGVPHQLGAKVNLDMEIDGKRMSKTFRLSGYYEADQYLAVSGMAFVSEAFVQEDLSGIDPKQTRDTGSYVNTTRLDVLFYNSYGIEDKIKKVLSDTGMNADYGVNWAYASVGIFEDPVNILPFVGLILITMLSGYLLIYNIFHISVVRDIKFYGLVKTIGTTPRQVRKTITIQANRLYLIALPIGLLLGYGIGLWLTPMMNAFSTQQEVASYSASPLIFVAAALFSYLTVRIAASKPGRTAARISPIEAVRYTGLNDTGRKITKRSTNGAKLSRMALANVLRHKKKLVLMLASLSLSLILFSIIYTVIGSLNVDKYLSTFISGDLVVKEKPAAGEARGAAGTTAVTEEIAKALAAVDGVESVDKVYFQSEKLKIDENIKQVLEPMAESEDPRRPFFTSILNSGIVWLQLHGIGPGWYDVVLKDDIVSGTFDREKFATGDYVLITETLLDGNKDLYASYYQPGDKIKLDGMDKEYKIMAVLNPDALYAAGTQFYTSGGFKVFFPAEEFARAIEHPGILSATIHADPAKLGQVEQTVRALVDSDPNLMMKSREDYKQEMNGFIRVFRTIGYGLSLIIALIGILNYVNTVITGIISRRNEFAILESVGMTRKQLKKTLMYEGLYGIILVGVIAGTVGLYLTYLVAKGIADNLAFTVFNMSVWPIATSVPLLVVISLAVTLAAYRWLSKATIVERLREAE